MKTITISENGIGRYDDASPFVIADKTLEVQVELPSLNGEFYLVTKLNKSTNRYLLEQDTAVTLRNLSAGELKAEVKHYLSGELIKTYKVESLVLKETESSLSATPEIGQINRKIKSAESSIIELKNSLKTESESSTKNIHALYVAFASYAWADYERNVFINTKSLSFEEFASQLGLPDFTDEELEKIKSMKENL